MTRVAIVGAGIIGTALADRLAAGGAEVILIDGADPGRGTSRTSLGWLNANDKHPRSYFELSAESMQAWRELAAEFGDPAWYQPTGNLAWATSPSAREELQARVHRLADWGYAAELITPHYAGALEPGLRIRHDADVAFFRDEGYVDGLPAVQALASRASAAGAVLHTGQAVDGLLTSGGRVTGVRLAWGMTLEADVVVCCAGWRTGELVSPLGVSLPLVDATAPRSKAPGLLVTFLGLRNRPRRVIHAPHFHARPGASGSLLLGATDIDAEVDLAGDQSGLMKLADRLRERAANVIPAVGGTHALPGEVCVRPLPSDGHPIAGWAPGVDGLYVAVTHSGITLAPVLARHMATEIIDGGEMEALAAYRPGR
jgi:glycine/D-amino acid oxidase-like deaminating enzyme